MNKAIKRIEKLVTLKTKLDKISEFIADAFDRAADRGDVAINEIEKNLPIAKKTVSTLRFASEGLRNFIKA